MVQAALRRHAEMKKSRPDVLFMFRMGAFYELFEDDAKIASAILNVPVAPRSVDESDRRVSVCGVPYHSVDKYVAKLIEAGYVVSVCDDDDQPEAVLLNRTVMDLIRLIGAQTQDGPASVIAEAVGLYGAVVEARRQGKDLHIRADGTLKEVSDA